MGYTRDKENISLTGANRWKNRMSFFLLLLLHNPKQQCSGFTSKPVSVGNGHLHARVNFSGDSSSISTFPHNFWAGTPQLPQSLLPPAPFSQTEPFSYKQESNVLAIFCTSVFKHSPLYRKGKLQSYWCVSGEKFTSLNSDVANEMNALLPSLALREVTSVQNPRLILP